MGIVGQVIFRVGTNLAPFNKIFVDFDAKIS
jgi:hypothetical protein